MFVQDIFFATEITQRPLLIAHYAHIKQTPVAFYVVALEIEDTNKMTAPRVVGLLAALISQVICRCWGMVNL